MKNVLTEKFLPIGSVVKVKDINDPVMILGYFSFPDIYKAEMSDYIGCNYYQGFNDNSIRFHKDAIENVLFMGYKNEKVSNFLNELTKMRKKFEDGKSVEEVFTDYLERIKEKGEKDNG